MRSSPWCPTVSDNFLEALKFTLKWEGGYSHDPADPGGETYCGVSRQAHPEWEGWLLVDGLIAKNSPSPELDTLVQDLYRTQYWNRCGCPQLPPRLAIAVFDWAVNSGPERALKALQRLVGAPSDGLWGPKTLEALQSYMDRQVAIDIHVARRQFVDRLNNPRFTTGWMNRLNALSTILTK